MTQEQVAERLGVDPPSSAASSAVNAARTGAPSAASSQPSTRASATLPARSTLPRTLAVAARARPDFDTQPSAPPPKSSNRRDARHSERCAIAVSYGHEPPRVGALEGPIRHSLRTHASGLFERWGAPICGGGDAERWCRGRAKWAADRRAALGVRCLQGLLCRV